MKRELKSHKKKTRDAKIALDPALRSEIELIDMIFWKYKPQQRSQRWFKYLAILHRRLTRFVQTNSVDLDSASFIVYKLAKPAAVAFQGILNQGAFITLGFALIALLARVYSILHALVPQRAATELKLLKSIQSADLGGDLGGDLGAGLGDDLGIEVENDNRTPSSGVTIESTTSSASRKVPGKVPGKVKSKTKTKALKSGKPSKPKKKSIIDDIFK